MPSEVVLDVQLTNEIGQLHVQSLLDRHALPGTERGGQDDVQRKSTVDQAALHLQSDQFGDDVLDLRFLVLFELQTVHDAGHMLIHREELRLAHLRLF